MQKQWFQTGLKISVVDGMEKSVLFLCSRFRNAQREIDRGLLGRGGRSRFAPAALKPTQRGASSLTGSHCQTGLICCVCVCPQTGTHTWPLAAREGKWKFEKKKKCEILLLHLVCALCFALL